MSSQTNNENQQSPEVQEPIQEPTSLSSPPSQAPNNTQQPPANNPIWLILNLLNVKQENKIPYFKMASKFVKQLIK